MKKLWSWGARRPDWRIWAGRAGRAVMDMMVGSPAAVPSLPLPPPRPAAHCGAVRAPHHSARSRCPSRPATHSEASMRRTLISYYSFYTQQGGRPVQYGVPYDSWWQLRGSTQVDAVSPGLVNPPPTTHPTPQRPPPYSATNRPPWHHRMQLKQKECYLLLCLHSSGHQSIPTSECKYPDMQGAHDPNIQICAIDAIVELSASLPGDAPAYQSGFNFSFWLTPPVYYRSTTEYTKGCKAKSYMVSRTTSHRMELNHGKFGKIFSSRTPAIVWESDAKKSFLPNQIAPSINIMLELCYLSLDQWEILLLWGKCFNIPHWSRSLSTNAR